MEQEKKRTNNKRNTYTVIVLVLAIIIILFLLFCKACSVKGYAKDVKNGETEQIMPTEKEDKDENENITGVNQNTKEYLIEEKKTPKVQGGNKASGSEKSDEKKDEECQTRNILREVVYREAPATEQPRNVIQTNVTNEYHTHNDVTETIVQPVEDIYSDDISQLKTELANLKESVEEMDSYMKDLDHYYPVGSLYLSLTETDPAEILGGEWEQVASGQNLMGAGNEDYPLGSEGGSATYTITKDNLPNYNLIVSDPGHSHGVYDPGHVHGTTVPAGEDYADRYSSFVALTGTQASATAVGYTGIGIYGNKTGISVNSGGGGKEMSLLSPYLVVNIWKRVA